MLYSAKSLKILIAGAVLAAGSIAAQIAGSSEAQAADYFNGFETDTDGWFGSITRVLSGTNGIPSKTGSWHAEADGVPAPGTSNVITQWGGNQSVFPAAGYVTSLDIYLKFPPSPLSPLVNDTRFDWSSAINKPDGTHRQDFVFNVGFYNDADATGAGPRFVVTGSNNATRSGANPKNPARQPFVIITEGWYTFEHRFDNVGGALVVTLIIKNAAGVPLASWILSTAPDSAGNIIGTTVGGSRYGWLVINEFDFLAIDNSLKDETDVEQAVDHFACYDVHEHTRLANRNVTLDDQFGPLADAEIRKTEILCAPVDKNGEGVIFEDFHLVCYDVQKGNDPRADVRVDNQFGEQDLQVRRVRLLCVPLYQGSARLICTTISLAQLGVGARPTPSPGEGGPKEVIEALIAEP
jgi:hypothetical protein